MKKLKEIDEIKETTGIQERGEEKMSLFNDWKKKRRSEDGSYEFFEDTHNEYGDYVGKPERGPDYTATPGVRKQQYDSAAGRSREYRENTQGYRLPDAEQYVSPRNYQNVVVYKPRSPEDVQTLIDFLKRREPAIVNLDETDADSAQRILDFISGAIYSLSGSVHRIAGNIFLLSPEGVEITVPYDKNEKI